MSDTTKDNMRTMPISGRIAEEDFQYLMESSFGGKVTASEKLRHVASFYRQYHESLDNYVACLNELKRLLAPFHEDLKTTENHVGLRSDLLSRLQEFTPEVLALLVTARCPDDKGKEVAYLTQLEGRLLDATLSLLEGVLRMGLTKKAPAYNPHLLHDKLDTICELVSMLESRKVKPDRIS